MLQGETNGNNYGLRASAVVQSDLDFGQQILKLRTDDKDMDFYTR